jgi:putative DNA primase/helicase
MQNPGAPRNDIARLHGARFVKAAESQKEAVLDEATVKELTGGDTVTARFLFKEFFQFRPQFKLWVTTNHLFTIRGTEAAIWRRLKLIPFRQAFMGKRRDPCLRQKLEEELSGILVWGVEGCLLWQKTGLGEAPAVEKATLGYRQDSDHFGRFLEDCCTTQPGDKASGAALFQAYIGWCRQRGERPETNNAFAAALVERGIHKKRTKNGVVYEGVGLVLGPGRELPGEAGKPDAV